MKTILMLAMVFLTGCASLPGLKITDEERAACEAEGCTPWTVRELQMLIQAAMQRGYQAGKKSL